MKIERKRVDKISISHNKSLLIVIIILIIILGIVVYSILKDKSEIKNIVKECDINNECVASSCCHAEFCITKDKAPVCDKVFCSQVCSGPLDCGAGHCGCVNSKCSVIKN